VTEVRVLFFIGLAISGCSLSQDRPVVSRRTLHLRDGVVMEFVRIPAGILPVGSTEGLGTRDGVISQDFWMQTTEVTQAQWKAVIGALRCACGGEPEDTSDPQLPMTNLNQHDCWAFVRKLNAAFRNQLGDLAAALPKESEWEYACRAGTRTRWHFGDDESRLSEHAWYEANSRGVLHPVALKKPNPWGLYDMYGNAEEWCADAVPEAEVVAGRRMSGDRAARGGDVGSASRDIASARRWWRDPI
jgi:formylglycine-generating enzyme required for sulfatase activity